MAKTKFRFNIEDNVFILGRKGLCKIVARGVLIYTDNITMIVYHLIGAYNDIVNENLLLSVEEEKELLESTSFMYTEGVI